MVAKNEKIILSIETSCDETAAAVLSVRLGKKWPQIKTLSSVVNSQIGLHAKMGGVVPEAAARAHVQNILPVVKKTLLEAGISQLDGRQVVIYEDLLKKIDYIAVTVGPGLAPSLIVGVEFAKALSFALGKPILPINHMLGHLYSPLKNNKGSKAKDVFPMVSLIVSGGHTILTLLKNEKEYRVLGQTVDDAAGEAFDKVAKLLSLPYPGGPEVSKLATLGKPTINFPRPMLTQKNYNFSFAGLKTAVLYYLRDNPLMPKSYKLKANLCSSFQQAVVDVLVAKTMRAAKEFKAKSISLSGGVSANLELRNQLRNSCNKNHFKFFVSPIKLCTDNAEMIGIAAAFKLFNGFKPTGYKNIKTNSNLSL